ncbi:DUF4062 domain-containing protein [Clostridiales bacterium FE2010]|nr:DUF4062 domain-containing protein [Clostridiales bacterium FE2010]
MGKKYQVFISSTYEDLREERDKVRDAILSMYHFPVGMELFGAASEEQWEIIKETIDTSDYYILIVGQRYGTVIPDGPDKGISYTEKEFRYAKEKGIPILAFLIDDSVPVKAVYVEKKHNKEFNKFKAAVKSGRTVSWWKNSDELAQQVTAALHKQIERTPRQGWMRTNDFQEVTNQAQAIIKLINDNQKLTESYEKLKQEDNEHKTELENCKVRIQEKADQYIQLEKDYEKLAKEHDNLFGERNDDNPNNAADIDLVTILLHGIYVLVNEVAIGAQSMLNKDFFDKLKQAMNDLKIFKTLPLVKLTLDLYTAYANIYEIYYKRCYTFGYSHNNILQEEEATKHAFYLFHNFLRAITNHGKY